MPEKFTIGFKGFGLSHPSALVLAGGRWGGLGWTDGKRDPSPSEINWDGEVAENASGAPSKVDQACKDHDINYRDAENQLNEMELRLRADLKLVKDLNNILLSEMDIKETIYRDLAKEAFIAKIMFCDIPFAGLEEIQNELAEYLIQYGPSLDPYGLNNPFDPSISPGDDTSGGIGGHGDNGEGSGGYDSNNGGSVDAQIGNSQSRQYNWYSPLVLDLDGDGLEYVNLAQSNAYFDLDADDFASNAAWLSPDDGFLALDWNSDGIINNINELFGDKDGHGFDILSGLDTNSDNVINNQDTQFADLMIWQDLNNDGISQANELATLDQVGITSIDLSYTILNTQATPDVKVVAHGTFAINGSTATVQDVIFKSYPESTKYVGPYTLDPGVLQVANLKGYGRIPDLHISMSLDSILKQAVLDAMPNITLANIDTEFQQILFKWAGVENITLGQIDPDPSLSVDPNTGMIHFPTADVDLSLQQLGFIMKYAGLDVLHISNANWFEEDSLVTSGGYYKKAWEEAYRNLLVKFAVANGYLYDYLDSITYDPEVDEIHLGFDASYYAGTILYSISYSLAQNPTDFANVNGLMLSVLALLEVDPSMKDLLLSNLIKILDDGNSDLLAPVFNNSIFQVMNLAVSGTTGSDNLIGDVYHDLMVGFSGNDYLYGVTGNDTLFGGIGNDTLHGGDENDLLIGGDGDDILDGDQAHETWTGNLPGDDTLRGGAGNDTLTGGLGNDTYLFGIGDGQDTIIESGTESDQWDDVIILDQGITPDMVTISYDGCDLYLKINGTNDQILVQNHFLNDGVFNANSHMIDGIQFADGTYWDYVQIKNQALMGGPGNDSIQGYSTSDILHGGPGNDTLNGNAGSDTYVFGLGDGQDVINNTDQGYTSSTDILQFEEGITPDMVALRRGLDAYNNLTNDLYVEINGTTDQVELQNFFTNDGNDQYAIDAIAFHDGSTWSRETIKQMILSGGAGSDKIQGYATDDILHGNDGDDYLYGLAGNDTLHGGSGNDYMYGGPGNNIMYGGEGNDYIEGNSNSSGTGNNLLSGGDGDDNLRGNRNDTLDGGAGNDYLNTEGTILFGIGDGQEGVNIWYTTSTARIPRIVLDPGITPDMVTILGNQGLEDDLFIKINGTSDQIWIPGYFAYQNSPDNLWPYLIQFADGTTWDSTAINQRAIITLYRQGTYNDDTIQGVETNDVINGLQGRDALYGNGGDDVLYGNIGRDNLYGGEGNDTLDGGADIDALYGGNGNDLLKGGAADDFLQGDSGDDTLYGENDNDNLTGGDGNDMLIGGLGNDTLNGGTGSDTYYYNLGDGNDTINNYDTSAGRNDVLVFGQGITPEDIVLSASGTHLNISVDIDGSYGTVKVLSFLNGGGAGGYALDRIQFADSTTWYTNTIINNINMFYGTTGDDTLTGNGNNNYLDGDLGNDVVYGLGGDDSVIGSSGNDTLYGGEGNDLLSGDGGNDYLEGGSGNDLYVYGFGDGGPGQDIINNYDTTPGRNDMLDLTMTPDDVVLSRNGNDLVITVYGTTHKVTVSSFFSNNCDGGYALDAIRFYDGPDEEIGTIWDKEYIRQMFPTQPTTGNDILEGTAANDTIDALAGNDIVYGYGGDDNLLGNTGNDTLYGGDGNDTLNGGAGTDSLFGGTGNDIFIVDSTSDVVTEAAGEGIDRVQSSVTYTLGANVENLTLTGTSAINATGNTLDNYLIGNSANNKLTGNAGNDTMDGGAGSDTMTGGTGDDIYVVNATGDKVTESTSAGTDTVLSSITYTLGSNVENLTLTGTSALNGTGNTLNNYLTGNIAANSLSGSSGNDTLCGGAGDDTLDGGSGSDTYIFGAGAEGDIINNNDSGTSNLDTASYTDATRQDLWFSHNGNNLVVTVAGTTDQVTVNNWYSGTSYQLDQFTSGGYVLSNAMVEQLVIAMAGYAVPYGAGNTIPQEVQDALAPVIAVTWQPYA